MTRDEMKQLIAESINGEGWVGRGPDGDAEAVLAAFAARGLIVGEMQDIDGWLFHTFPGSKQYAIEQSFMDDEGLALVRVVE